jgi:hypothetical protein
VPGVFNVTGLTINGLTSDIVLASGATPEVARIGTVTLTEP